MYIDRYTKVVLTFIALSLTAIAIRGVVPGPAVAQSAAEICRDYNNPCYVTIRGAEFDIFGLPLPVEFGLPLPVQIVP